MVSTEIVAFRSLWLSAIAGTLLSLGCVVVSPESETSAEPEPSVESQDGVALAGSTESQIPRPLETKADVVTPRETKVSASTPAPPVEPSFTDVVLPAGTLLDLELLTPLDSAANVVGDEVRARTLSPLEVHGRRVLEAGSEVEGRVTDVEASGKVKGLSKLAFAFDRLTTPFGVVDIRTSFVSLEAESGKKKDAAVIGGAAGVGAIVGGIIGGKKGAAIGASIGGAGGTGVVLSTKGEEIRLAEGTELEVRLDAPVSLRLPES